MAAKASGQRRAPTAATSATRRRPVAVARGGPVAHVLALQRSAGNAAVVALLAGQSTLGTLQRQPAPAADLTSEMSQEDAEYIAEEVQDDFTDFYNALMRANVIPNTTQYRHNLMLQLDAIGIDAAVDRGVFTDPLTHMNDITVISEKLRETKEKSGTSTTIPRRCGRSSTPRSSRRRPSSDSAHSYSRVPWVS